MTADTEETKEPEDAAPTDAAPTDAAATDAAATDGEQPDTESAAEETPAGDDVEISSPEFQEMVDGGQTGSASTDLNRFQDIKVTVSADLGRASVPLQTLMGLGEGSILELNREIDSPVELVAQGVPLAAGEVVVVNGCFAIRVTKVYEKNAA